MRTNNTPNPDHAQVQPCDPTAVVLREQWQSAILNLDSFEFGLAQRHDAARARTARHTEKLASLLAKREGEYEQDRGRVRCALEVCTQDLNAAHRSASRHCGEIGVRYVPGKTTEIEILRVPRISQAEAARSLDLKNGGEIAGERFAVLKTICTVLCAIVTSVAWGLLLFHVNYQKPLSTPLGFVLSLFAGTLVALAVRYAITRSWSLVGTREGFGKGKELVSKAWLAAIGCSVGVLCFLIGLDGLGIAQANAARASLNPAAAIPLWLALIAASAINFAYVVGFAYASHADAYNTAASGQMSGLIQTDQALKQEVRKAQVLVQAALDALGQINIIESRIEDYKAEFKQLEIEFTRAMTELLNAMPEEPSGATLQEISQLKDLRDKVAVAKERYDAHLSSRSVNHAIATSNESDETEN